MEASLWASVEAAGRGGRSYKKVGDLALRWPGQGAEPGSHRLDGQLFLASFQSLGTHPIEKV